MKKLYLICILNLLFAFTCNFTFAQNKNWQIGLKVIPEWSNLNNYPTEIYGYNYIYTNINNQSKFIWNLGFQINRQINKSIYLESGIYYTNKAVNVNGNFDPCPLCFIPIKSSLQSFSRQYSYLNIPLILKFNIKGFYAGSGIGINKYISQKADDSQFTSYEINNWVFDLPVILGYQRKIYRSLNVFLEGRYTPTLSKIYKNSNEKVVNYGIGFGVNWTLNKK